MPRYLVTRTQADLEEVRAAGDHRDSRKAAWLAIKKGGEVIREVQRISPQKHKWVSLEDALPVVDEPGRALLRMRLEAIDRLKRAPHHARGFRLSAFTGTRECRPVNSLCLISGHADQEIPGLVAHDRVVVDVEYMEQALGPATVDDIFKIRKKIGEHVYISTNVSETPQIVRSPVTGQMDNRSTAALTATKVIAALEAGADVVKVGFANLDIYKRDLKSETVLEQMKKVRQYVDSAVRQKAIVMPLNQTGRYPLISVFFPEIGIDSNGERPFEIAEKGIRLTAQGGWQGLLIDTFEKTTGRAYKNFYTVEDTAKLARMAHDQGLEFWIAGSIKQEEVAALVRSKVDLICFGGAARHKTGIRKEKQDESIKRPLVEQLAAAFDENDPRESEP